VVALSESDYAIQSLFVSECKQTVATLVNGADGGLTLVKMSDYQNRGGNCIAIVLNRLIRRWKTGGIVLDELG
jgi:hypothetical protein